MSDEKSLSIQEMLSADDVEHVWVPTPEWKSPRFPEGGSAHLKSMDANEMIEFSEANRNSEKDSPLRLVVYSLVNDDGTRVPKADREKTIELLSVKNVRVLNRLVDAAMKLQGVHVERSTVKNDSGEVVIASSPIV